MAGDAFAPVAKRSLADTLAQRIRESIQSGQYQAGDRLPSIAEMARRFRVGNPTVREALQRLALGRVVEIRHGAGVFVSRSEEPLVVATPDASGTITPKLRGDVIDTRIPLEVESVAQAASKATDPQLDEMRRLLGIAGEHLGDDELLGAANVAFHRQIALASGNVVLAQLLDVLRELYRDEQRELTAGLAARERCHHEHLDILRALERRNGREAGERMREHLEGLRRGPRPGA
jgi:GntR family transcriptional regulator, transcriptional repressor for pyruvate dehydrogenase complex